MHAALLHWIATAGEPLTTAEVWDELTLKGLREPPAGLPQRLGELSSAVLALIVAGKLEEKGGKLHVVRKVAKAERRLF